MGYGQYSYNGHNGATHAYGTRYAKVFSSDELPHLWAHQSKSEGRSKSSMSFVGLDFYSYSTVIGSIAKAKDGKAVYLVSDGQYSVTTSRHQSNMRMAIPRDAVTFTVPATSRYTSQSFNDSGRIMDAWRLEIESRIEDASKARQPKKGRLLAEAATIAGRMREYGKLMGAKTGRIPRIPATVDELSTYITNSDKREAARKRTSAKAAEKAAAERRIKNEADYKAWLEGQTNVDTYNFRDFPTALRVRGSEVETSRGASFPVDHARRGLALVRAVVAKGEEWRTNGHTCHLGHYSIDRITPDGTVYAGCHVVPFESIARIAPELESVSA